MTPAPAQNRKQRLSFRLAVFILTSTTLIFGAAFGYNYYFSRELVLINVRKNAASLTQALVNRLETRLKVVEQVPGYLALRLEKDNPSTATVISMVRDLVANNPDIFGSTAAFEPYTIDLDARYFAPYFFTNTSGGLEYSNLGRKEYDYFHRDWYAIPQHLQRAVWSEPYYDEGGGNIVMSTYSVPFYRHLGQERSFSGVVTADICLDSLVQHILDVALYDSGYAFLISSQGTFVAHPAKDWIMRKSIFSLAEEMDMPDLRRVGRSMIKGEEGFAEFTSPHTGQDSLLYYAPVTTNGWAVGVMIPKQEMYADISFLNQTVLLIGIVGFSILFLVVVGISRSITRPLHSLVASTREIAKGNLDVNPPQVRVNDEVGQLTKSVDSMRLALKEYITNLTETTKAKERIESELKIARNIQMNFLPRHFPPFPDRQEFEIFAALEPARHVGGDLYDFFLLDDDHMFFSVGDVADKGVPAALFMAVTKTLMKGIAEQGLEPSEVLARVNNELCQGNESSMFVTLFCGILNLRSGELRYSNAGHNPPLVLSPGQDPQWLDLPPGLVLGGMEDMVFQTRTRMMLPGEKLLAYTDGVTEAMNPAQELYSEQRLESEVRGRAAAGPEDMVSGILQSVHAFASGADQSDDITLLALLYKGQTSAR
ncbi:MAG: SpoIIE family protein phosphatase [Desulfovermiculus sp.]